MKNVRDTFVALLAAGSACITSLSAPPVTHAQDVCTGNPATCERDYSLDVATVAVQPSVPVFKFQSRISQAKLPLGDVTFSPVKVRILKEGYTLNCSEEIYDVLVRDSVLNLEIGHGMTCDLPSVMAKHDSLSFQICIESDENCLKPVTMAHVPYAVKSEIAVRSNRAATADIAAQCHYTHRASADANLTNGSNLGHGYFDFHTPVNGTASLASWDVPSSMPGGFVAWTPVDPSAGANTMTVCGIAGEGGVVRPLDTLNLVSQLVNVTQGPLVAHHDATLRGQVSVEAGLFNVTSPTTIEAPTSIIGTTTVTGTTTINGATTINGSARVEGPTTIVGATNVSGNTSVTGTTTLTGATTVNGETRVNTDRATTGMQVMADGTVHFWGAPIFHVAVDMPLEGSTVTSDSVVDGSLTAADLGTNSVGASEIASGAVRSDEVLDNSLTAADLATGSVEAAEIATGAVRSAEVLDNSLTASDLAPNSVGSSEIATGAVASSEVLDNSLTASDLAANSVGASEIATSAVGSSEVLNNSLTASDLATNSVGSAEIASGAVRGDEVLDRSLRAGDINWLASWARTGRKNTNYTTSGNWHLCVLNDVWGDATCWVEEPSSLPGRWTINVSSGWCGMMCFN